MMRPDGTAKLPRLAPLLWMLIAPGTERTHTISFPSVPVTSRAVAPGASGSAMRATETAGASRSSRRSSRGLAERTRGHRDGDDRFIGGPRSERERGGGARHTVHAGPRFCVY